MNTLAIDFSVDWFLTIPGMLITGGVLLLIIALIIFITSGSKKEKPKKDAANANVSSTPDMSAQMPNQAGFSNNMAVGYGIAQNMGQDPMMNAVPEMNANPMGQGVQTPSFMQMTPTEPAVNDVAQGMNLGNIPPVVEQPTVAEPNFNPVLPTVEATPTVPEVNVGPTMPQSGIDQFTSVQPVNDVTLPPVEPVVETPQNTNVIMDTPIANSEVVPPVEPIVQPEVSSMDIPMPTVEAPVVPEVSVNDTVAPEVTPSEATVVSDTAMVTDEPKGIYGGVEPVVPDMSQPKEVSHEIYGGANPLENTQPIPVVPRSAYQGESPLPEEMSNAIAQENSSAAPKVEETVPEATPVSEVAPVEEAPSTTEDVEVLDF